MIPLAIVHYGVQAPRFFSAVEKPDQRENAVGNAGEGTAVQQLDASVEKGRDLTLAAATWATPRVDQIVAAALIADRRHGALQQQGCVHAFGIKSGGEALQGALLTVEPEHVAVDDKKGVIEQWQRTRDAAASLQQLGFVGNLDAGVVAAGQLCGDHLGPVMHIDDDPFDPGQGEPVDRMIEQGAAVYLDKRFRNGFGHRPQPGAEPGGEHHRRSRRNHHAEMCRAERGKWRSSHRAIGSRAGWASSCSSRRQIRGRCTR
jgi:hypothetical protein